MSVHYDRKEMLEESLFALDSAGKAWEHAVYWAFPYGDERYSRVHEIREGLREVSTKLEEIIQALHELEAAERALENNH